MPLVRLGNCAALYKEDVLDGDYVSEITVHETDPRDVQIRNITHTDGLWSRLSAQPATWVSCPEDPRLEAALAAHFDCPIGEPDLRTDTEAEADRNAEQFRGASDEVDPVTFDEGERL